MKKCPVCNQDIYRNTLVNKVRPGSQKWYEFRWIHGGEEDYYCPHCQSKLEFTSKTKYWLFMAIPLFGSQIIKEVYFKDNPHIETLIYYFQLACMLLTIYMGYPSKLKKSEK